MSDLAYVPLTEFDRVRALRQPATTVTELFAALGRINTLYMIARAGSGHIGTSFSSIDVVAWLFLNELRLPDGDARAGRDLYLSSKGHDVPALYSVLIGLRRLPFEMLHRLRRLGGLPGHPDVRTPYIEANTGSLGMGISKAKGMAWANRVRGERASVYVLTGDGELQEGQFWESLITAANHRLSEITVIVDHNKIQSDTWVARTSDLGDLAGKLERFGWRVARCDGHDLGAVAATLSELRGENDRPKILIADTVKGRGVSFMEPSAMKGDDALYRFHSGAPDEDTYDKALQELVESAGARLAAVGQAPLRLETAPRESRVHRVRPQRLIAAYSQELVKQAERHPELVVLDADLVLDCGLIPFRERFPERFVECGIAEQDMVSQAGGMARQGCLPVVHSFACFLSSRPNEQIYNNASERAKIVYVGSLAGLLPGGPGHSHQCVRDISALAAIPRLVLLEPCHELEAAQALDFCVNGTTDSSYLRLVSVAVEVPYELPSDYRLSLGRGVTLHDGADVVLIGYGSILLTEACKAADRLRQQHGISARVVNLPWLNRVDTDWLRQALAGARWLFTLDNHYVIGGQGDMLLRELAQLDPPLALRAKRLGVTDIPVCGTNEEVLRAHGLDADMLCQEIAAVVGRHDR